MEEDLNVFEHQTNHLMIRVRALQLSFYESKT
jgi:hypothetical protein